MWKGFIFLLIILCLPIVFSEEKKELSMDIVIITSLISSAFSSIFQNLIKEPRLFLLGLLAIIILVILLILRKS